MTLSRAFAIAALSALALNSAPAFSDSDMTGAAHDMTDGQIARAIVTTDVIDREPVDEVKTLMNDSSMVYFFTELTGMKGHNVTHRWTFNGKVMGEVPFEVRGPRWRVWSSKNLDSVWLGKWKVSVVDESGNVLQTKKFHYTKHTSPASQAE